MHIQSSDHAALLQKMTENAFMSPWASVNGTANTLPTLEECQARLDAGKNIDYFWDRAIKTNFSTPAINFRLFNRDSQGLSGEECAKALGLGG